MVAEARLEQTESGLAPATEGWFVLNVADATWLRNDAFGACAVFEGDGPEVPDIGYTLGVLQPGRPSGLYHRESNQEDFLVLAGECVLLVEGEERRLRAWDFVHCPPGTEHIFVGAGDGPCVVFMIGGRTREHAIVYPRSELALAHGAGVETETPVPSEAYAPFPDWRRARPASMSGLPWE
ncbi:MAG TPA: cupin domain-containing protein [Gaiellaceae bacterium]|nr:cupin domain-containing protein [Gaiellaceae bacterium]